eukprot:3829169-Alexandrium_andersonii.AAC.1
MHPPGVRFVACRKCCQVQYLYLLSIGSGRDLEIPLRWPYQDFAGGGLEFIKRRDDRPVYPPVA